MTAEADYISLRLREIAVKPLSGDYSINHLTKMHQYIFQHIYAVIFLFVIKFKI